MGEDGEGSADQQSSYDQPSYDQPSYDQPSYDQPSSGNEGNGAGGDARPAGLSEDLFNQLGTLYGNGDFQGAIDRVKPLVDAGQADPLWGRAAYGLVMCYDQLRDWKNAQRYLGQIMDNHGAHQRSEWQQQFECYTHGQHYTGPALLY